MDEIVFLKQGCVLTLRPEACPLVEITLPWDVVVHFLVVQSVIVWFMHLIHSNVSKQTRWKRAAR
jgi:hypothetical protein